MLAPSPWGGFERIALGLLATVAAALAAREIAAILVPFVIAIFLMMMVETIVRTLRAACPWVTRGSATFIAAALLAFSLLGSVWVVGTYAASLSATASTVPVQINEILAQLASSFGSQPLTLERLVGDTELAALGRAGFDGLQGFASGALLVAIYLGFLLASRRSILRKFVRLFNSDGSRPRALRVMRRVESSTAQYIWVQTVTGIVIALGSWFVMTAVGQSTAPLLAFVIFLTSYIPVIGPFIGVIVPPVVGLAEFDGWTRPLILLFSLQAINFVINNLIVPRMQADRLNLDPIVILLSLGFWTWLWGLPGAFLAVPLTALVMAIATEQPSARWLAVILSKDGLPDPRKGEND
ncbi:AI-2E family transporter [Nostoc sp. CHAB 5824]|nr:AI-2E family transporter [Nostoc sp. CHAB 5824]